MSSLASMNGPSVTAGLPLSKRIVVAVRSGCNWWPPRILEPCLRNHWSTPAIMVPRSSSVFDPKSVFVPRVSPNSSTYFMPSLLCLLRHASRFVHYDEQGDGEIDNGDKGAGKWRQRTGRWR